MEFTPDTSPTKRTRAKPKVTAAKPAAVRPAAAKKPRAARKTATAMPAASEPAVTAEVQVVAATLDPTPQDVGTMIATAAYYLAAARDFSPGHELDDWLAAERAIHARLHG